MVSFAVCPSPTTERRYAKSSPKTGSSIASGPSTRSPAGVKSIVPSAFLKWTTMSSPVTLLMPSMA
jgi:hypothetical protein